LACPLLDTYGCLERTASHAGCGYGRAARTGFYGQTRRTGGATAIAGLQPWRVCDPATDAGVAPSPRMPSAPGHGAANHRRSTAWVFEALHQSCKDRWPAAGARPEAPDRVHRMAGGFL